MLLFVKNFGFCFAWGAVLVFDFDFELVFGFDYLDFEDVRVWFSEDIVFGID